MMTVTYKGEHFDVTSLVQPRETVWGLIYKAWAINVLTGLGCMLEVTVKGDVFRILN